MVVAWGKSVSEEKYSSLVSYDCVWSATVYSRDFHMRLFCYKSVGRLCLEMILVKSYSHNSLQVSRTNSSTCAKGWALDTGSLIMYNTSSQPGSNPTIIIKFSASAYHLQISCSHFLMKFHWFHSFNFNFQFNFIHSFIHFHSFIQFHSTLFP